MIGALIFGFLFSVGSAYADPGLQTDKLSFCTFGPKIKITHIVVDPRPAGNTCNGSAKIQGVMWECQNRDRLDDLVYNYRKNLGKLASEECTKHCESRGAHCNAKFRLPTSCGLTVDHEDAVALGKKFGCRSDCGGQSFIYCSLFDAGFQTDDDDMLAKQSPNCYCSVGRP